MFETALRNKYRFPFKGQVATEDLWDLSLIELDSIYKTLNKEVKARDEESLLVVDATKKNETNTKIDIIRYIVAIKLTEAEAKKQAAAKKAEKDKILAILAEKQDEELKNLTVEELKARLNNLYIWKKFNIYDYWNLITNILPELKEVMAHNRCLSIRGDSGDPVEIIEGKYIAIFNQSFDSIKKR